MKGNYFQMGMVFSLLGIIILGGVFGLSFIEGLDFPWVFLIFGISTIAMGIFWINQHFYWSRPERIEEYQKKMKKSSINVNKNYLQIGATLIFLGTIILGGTLNFAFILKDGLGFGWFFLIFGISTIAMGIFWIIRHFYWTRPERVEEYEKRLKKDHFKVSDERNESLGAKAGQMMFVNMMFINAIIFGGTLVLDVENGWRLLFFGLIIFQFLGYLLTYRYYQKKQ